MKKRLFLVFAVLLCVSCVPGSIYELEPISHGKDPAELKVSPCACIPVETLLGLPDWLTEVSV